MSIKGSGKAIFYLYVIMMLIQLIGINFFFQYEVDQYATQQETHSVYTLAEIADVENFYNLIQIMEIVVSLIGSVLMTVVYFALRGVIEYSGKLESDFYLDIESGLPNINALNADILGKKESTIALLNIDRFTSIRFIYGIKNSKSLLEKVNKRVFDFCKENNYKIYHINTDELVILPTDHREFKNKITMLVSILESADFAVGGVENIQIDLTVGFSKGGEQLIEKAGMAVIEAKKKRLKFFEYNDVGEFSVVGYNESLRSIQMVIEALKDDRVFPHYQPIVNRGGEITKYEALVRLEAKSGDILSPFHFLPAIMKTRYYKELTKRMIEKVFEDLKGMGMGVTINLTASDIGSNEILDLVIEKLSSCENASVVVFEIVESETMRDLEKIMHFIKAVRFFGAKIAIDDFGTGYSNLEVIRKINPDFIKIDGSLVKDIHVNEKDKIYLGAILVFMKNIGVKTVVEYVHCEEVFEIANELGADEFQGYFFGKPDILLSQNRTN